MKYIITILLWIASLSGIGQRTDSCFIQGRYATLNFKFAQYKNAVLGGGSDNYKRQVVFRDSVIEIFEIWGGWGNTISLVEVVPIKKDEFEDMGYYLCWYPHGRNIIYSYDKRFHLFIINRVHKGTLKFDRTEYSNVDFSITDWLEKNQQ